MPSRASMRLWALLVLVLLAGCRATVGGIVGDGCRVDADCDIGVCNPENQCAPRCATDQGCPEGARCEDFVCVGVPVPVRDAGVVVIPGEDGGASGELDGGSIHPGEDGGAIHPSEDGGSIHPAADGGPVTGGDGGRRDQCRDRGSRRTCGSSLGTCRTGEQECTGEFWGPCLGDVRPSEEQCDGEDHDCDGIPNNPVGGCDCVTGQTRACYDGPPETRGVGTCRDGSQACTAGRWGDCVGAVKPIPGRCDERSCAGDANPGCACAVNETRSCYSGAQAQVNVGICRAGTQTCVAQGMTAVWSNCDGEVTPKPERCDGTDQNCDNVPDNRVTPPCECRDGATRACYDGPADTRGVGTCRDGTQTCTDGRWGECAGSVKPIPGACLEASCAGTPNPGCACLPGNTRTCYSSDPREIGVGVCRAGTETCIRGTGGAVQWGPCVGERVKEAEQCDGLDHDCNGVPNDRVGGCTCVNGTSRSCYDGPAGTQGVGTCRAGTQSCANGNWGSCGGQITPIPGRCDVESCAGGPNPGCLCTLGDARTCYSGNPAQVNVGICRSGTQRCISFDTGGVGWGTCQGERLPEPEQCDGQDHDCSGTPDDRLPITCECRNGASRSCYNGPSGTLGVGTCAAGAQTCVDGRWGSCSGTVEPQTGQCGVASCTGPNNPNPGCVCIVGRTQSCYDGAPNTLNVGICRGGSQTCNSTSATSSAWGACQNQRLPETERCDNQDHDCNGVPNDRPGGCVCVEGQTQSCYSGPPGTAGVGTCVAGTQSCVNTAGTFAWGTCTGEVKPIPNNCNVASCTGPSDPNPGCACINTRTRACYDGPAGTNGNGICVGGTQTCATGAWGTCAGQTLPGAADLCVAPGVNYSTATRANDRTCNAVLDRHNPVANPTISAPSGVTLTPPAGILRALTVEPLVTVTFTGAATDQDGAGPFSYRWRLLSAPQNNTAGLSGAPGATSADISTQQAPTLFAQLAGDYTIAVSATDAQGCLSAEVQLLVRVKPHSAIHIQLTWDRSVDLDLQLTRVGTDDFFTADACYWGNKDPDWGVVDPHLDIDDLAGCNPENINYGAIGGTQPTRGTSYKLWVHYYCNRRGHLFTIGADPGSVCYEPTLATGAASVNATVKVFVDGTLAKIDTTTSDAIFTIAMAKDNVWTPVTLLYDASGVWRVQRVTTAMTTYAGCSADAGDATCVCGQLPNSSDPYCGTSGAACRQRFP